MRLITTIALSVICIGCASTASLQTDLDEVRALWDASVAAAEESDYAGWSDLFADDVEILHPSAGQRFLGRADVDRFYTPIFNRGSVYQSIETRRFDVQRNASGDMVWGTAEVRVVAGGQAQTVWFALVYRRIDGEWKLVLGFDAPVG